MATEFEFTGKIHGLKTKTRPADAAILAAWNAYWESHFEALGAQLRTLDEDLKESHDELRTLICDEATARAPTPRAGVRPYRAGEVAGSVSGGCVEGAVVTEALEVLRTGDRQLVSFGYSDDDQAFSVGLTCGGTIHLFVKPLDW